MYEAFEGIPRCTRIVDDVLAYDPEMKSHEEHARQILTRCAEKGITKESKRKEAQRFASQRPLHCARLRELKSVQKAACVSTVVFTFE